MPDNGNSVFWYSFGSNSVYVVTLSAEHSLETGSPQRQWFEGQLGAVNRTQYPWLVVAMHRPVYVSELEPDSSDYNVSVALRGIIGGLLQQWNVDLFVAGHYHSYERTCPVYGGACQGDLSRPRATIHLTVGTAGIGFDSPSYRNVSWSAAKYPTVFGYGKATVLGASSLRWQLIESGTGRVLDDVTIHSNHTFV